MSIQLSTKRSSESSDGLKREDIGIGFDAAEGNWENMMDVDPTKVTRYALQNAASVAAMFLTTEAVVANVPQENAGGGMPDMGGMM